MAYQLIDGDYAFDGNGALRTVDGAEALLQSVALQLRARRRRFYPNKDFGSFLDLPLEAPYEAQALALAQQATRDMDGVYVEKARIADGAAVFRVVINNREYEVSTGIDISQHT